MKRLLPLFLILLLLLSACGEAPAGEGGQSPAPAAKAEPQESPDPEAPDPEGEDPDEDELPILIDDGRPAPSPALAPAPVDGVPVPGGETVTLNGVSSYLRVDLPEGWTWAQAGGTAEGTVYGLWPESDPDFKVELHFWPQAFAMCGTGVSFEEYLLPNGQKATLAYERIGEELSWTLILPEAPDAFTIQFSAPYSLYETHRAELELLLGTIRQGVLAQTDAVRPETSMG